MAMKELTNFKGQNWLITPAALALNDPRPRNIHDQKWILVLSGVIEAGLSTDEVVNAILEAHFVPDIASPCDYAISHHAIPRPPGAEGFQYNVEFQAELWAPFAAVSASVNMDADPDNIGVTHWRPSPFRTGFDMFTGNPIHQIFDGIIVKCLVCPDASIWLLSYNITLLGKIVFTQIRIT
jgi:hypothetical protein